MDAADEAKTRGNRFFQEGQYQQAIDAFTEAISIDPSNAVYYSNRSGAYLKVNKAAQAVTDARKVVELRPEWPKGYSRLGTSLFYQKKYADAKAAYEKGLAKDTNDANLKDGLKNATAALSGVGAPQTLRQLCWDTTHAKFRTYQFALRALMIVSFVLYWTAGWGSPSLAAFSFANFFKLAAINYVSFLAYNHGTPKLNQAYAQRLIMDPATQSLLFALLFWFSTPYGLALFPVVANELVHFASFAGSLLLAVNSSLGSTLETHVFDRVMPFVVWAAVYHRVPSLVATLEVAIGLSLILELLTPNRNFMLLLVYWQLLRIRYMISPQLKNAFADLDRVVTTAAFHPRSPPIVGTAYSKLKDMLAKMVAVPEPGQQQAAPSSMPKCCIM
ncbi:hypothetical protein DYB26_004565 [Aphanomyces astaci]|uniref:Hsp70-Hsp90 organising protein n=1 Tax=Aphanomyces astaci TaxID=112090 RepID=A0A397EZ89_APHAT|nr:hypothetical protein DYB34_000751 [Aphanomyces astaci]RHZ09779.1 hypothetical protein DYB31_003264 [Aphanomyces astaci]RHZ13895.1 hypothetical protein DYB26_004565 [Aphanomyces astaci]